MTCATVRKTAVRRFGSGTWQRRRSRSHRSPFGRTASRHVNPKRQSVPMCCWRPSWLLIRVQTRDSIFQRSVHGQRGSWSDDEKLTSPTMSCASVLITTSGHVCHKHSRHFGRCVLLTSFCIDVEALKRATFITVQTTFVGHLCVHVDGVGSSATSVSDDTVGKPLQ